MCEDGKAQTITKLLFSSVPIHAVPFHSLSGLFERSNYFVVSQDNVRCYWGVRYACVKVCAYIRVNRYICISTYAYVQSYQVGGEARVVGAVKQRKDILVTKGM